jgi:hypothetical protein
MNHKKNKIKYKQKFIGKDPFAIHGKRARKITSPNRSVNAPALRASGVHSAAIRLLRSPTFGRAVFATQSPYMPAQTSSTAGTLYAMRPKLVGNME